MYFPFNFDSLQVWDLSVLVLVSLLSLLEYLCSQWVWHMSFWLVTSEKHLTHQQVIGKTLLTITEFNEYSQERVGEGTAIDNIQDEAAASALSSAWANKESIFASMWVQDASAPASV